jgi:hypothetical protein
MSTAASASGLPLLSDDSRISSSRRSRTRPAIAPRKAARSAPVVLRQLRNARFAAATARSTSGAPPAATWAITSSVAGLITGMIAPSAAGCQLPSM